MSPLPARPSKSSSSSRDDKRDFFKALLITEAEGEGEGDTDTVGCGCLSENGVSFVVVFVFLFFA